MDDIQVIKIVFGILPAIGGLVLLLIGFMRSYKYLVQERQCTAKTTGTVTSYTLASRGGEDSSVHLPVVAYTVNGKEYKVIGPAFPKRFYN
ncbi:MAG TPA: hypothetical protein DIW07_12260 [Lachnospiraceae bacterium]|jgi:hypothetical protein|uniref:DUF3592 domain-containing protein n=1 Tax=Muricomes intestini TaxID=1796634 RepID=A0A4R3K967_9FIRM|nr:hypothetical protein [Muricomes intestini]TCS79500.1 hypothetical protein EDD59_10886 [Muricomes intestini]HAX53451.1 hypothetical protein [Lachnospiraceae bacterium]HCR84152.1 hypothetical protein [Lachnospiraceae bacterium]